MVANFAQKKFMITSLLGVHFPLQDLEVNFFIQLNF
jgi:hypothetical protein